MSVTTFAQAITIAADPAVVAAAFASYSEHPKMHPLIVAVRHIATEVAPNGTPLERYLITDRVPLGPLRIKATYVATIYTAADGALISDAYQSPGIHLHNVTRCLAAGLETRVEETITITAPALLSGFVTRQAAISHERLLANLKVFLERHVEV